MPSPPLLSPSSLLVASSLPASNSSSTALHACHAACITASNSQGKESASFEFLFVARVWGAGGSAEEQLLWQRLRLTVLSHIWRVRSSRQRYQRRGDGDLSEEVIRGASTEIQQAIRRDWARTRLVDTQEEAGGGFCGFSGRDPSLTKAAFLKLWAGNNVLCHPSSLVAGGLYVCDPAGWLPPRAGGTGGGHRGGGGRGNPRAVAGGVLNSPPGQR